MNEKIRITVDGRPFEAKEGSMLLHAFGEMGVHVPTLCNHSSLDPSGACRLCVVEITHEDWNGWSGLVTSCLYPVEPGLQVFTRSERVKAARQTLLELYMARCPDSEVVKKIACEEGVDETPFPSCESADSCILCGLCTRVCIELGPSAIAPLGRGTEKQVGPAPDMIGEDCTGCGACAKVCPTGHISMEKRDGKLLIWNMEFPVQHCSVKTAQCRGCGLCEETCPDAIPRMAFFRNGNMVSTIADSACTGCGICAGACPTGAILQDAPEGEESLVPMPEGEPTLHGRTVVFACSRSPFSESSEDVATVPCVGRVTVDEMLECLARGADGVLLICRDTDTCPYGRGGKLCETRARAAQELAAYAGLGSNRIVFEKPGPGPAGPDLARAAFVERTGPSPLKEALPVTSPESGAKPLGMDRALEIMGQLRSRPELEPVLPQHLADLFEAPSPGKKEDALLYLGDLVELDILLSLVVPGGSLTRVFEAAAARLDKAGIKARPVVDPRELKKSGTDKVVLFCGCGLGEAADGKEIYMLDDPAKAQGPDDQCGGFRFAISSEERRALLDRMNASGPGFYECGCVHELAQHMVLSREGSWQGAFSGEPVLRFQQAMRAMGGHGLEGAK